jgi:hypothetical protein
MKKDNNYIIFGEKIKKILKKQEIFMNIDQIINYFFSEFE